VWECQFFIIGAKDHAAGQAPKAGLIGPGEREFSAIGII
jgi:hypothetical protein